MTIFYCATVYSHKIVTVELICYVPTNYKVIISCQYSTSTLTCFMYTYTFIVGLYYDRHQVSWHAISSA